MPNFRFEFKNIPYKAAIIISLGFFFIALGIAISFVMYGGIKIDTKNTPPQEQIDEPIIDNPEIEGSTIVDVDGLKLEQKPAPGTKLTIERDGKTTTITKGGPPSEEP